ncbi:MAG TPA: RNA 2',3'-cyclic phosphodiesterase [Candidatus Acidoferrales bacterium]|nr:RNA 2',3'-cyclic phosphodiesterase [Candidatus Acidoferrales bacterium]
MRLFTALDLPPEVVANLEEVLLRLKPAARIQWSRPENLHITIKFIGELAEERLGKLRAALEAVPRRGAIAVQVRRVGFFPNPHAPRNFWCGIEAPGLDVLATENDSAAAAVGVERETRPFSPHLTLARVKDRLPLQPLREAIAGLPSLEFGAFEARSFFLYRSTLKPGGSVYTKLAEFPLIPS